MEGCARTASVPLKSGLCQYYYCYIYIFSSFLFLAEVQLADGKPWGEPPLCGMQAAAGGSSSPLLASPFGQHLSCRDPVPFSALLLPVISHPCSMQIL